MENGSKVSALTPKTFVFVPEMSAGDPSVDLVTTVNIPAVVSYIRSFKLSLILKAPFRSLNKLRKRVDVAEYYGNKFVPNFNSQMCC